jgi:hypothetical protein
LREPIRQRLAVEPKPPARAAQADAAELSCVLVDPISLDAEEPGYVGGIHEPGHENAGSGSDQLGNTLRDLLDIRWV